MMIDLVDKWAFEVSSLVRQKVAHLGEEGERWLAGLADLIADVEREWSITVAQPLTGGSASYVVRARTADGQDVVLKLAIPEQDFVSQVRTISAAEGRGYVGLLACDIERRAILLEALGPSMDHLELPPERMIEALCQALRQAWQVPWPTDLTVLPAQEKTRVLSELVSRLWEELGRPCSERVVAQALRFAERRAAAFDLGRCVVVHGDPHPGNALQVVAPRMGAESGFVLRDWCVQLLAADDASALARRYCRLLATETGVDETAIWEWGFLERVSTGLYVLDFGAGDLSRPFLDTAELLT